MPEPDPLLLEAILRHCADMAPVPWYPSEHAKAIGVDRDSLDLPLEKLRLGGLVQLTDWVQGKGQGYRLTPEGTALLNDARALGRLQGGELPQPPPMVTAAFPSTADRATTYERGEAVRDAFLNPSVPVVARTLIVANILLFLATEWVKNKVEQNQAPGLLGEIVLPTFGVNRQSFASGQWWRVLTYAFYHGGVMHIAMNMYALYVLGGVGERLWGHGRFAVLYFLSALGGGCAVLLTSDVRAVGASGAICGLFAAEGVWLLLNRGFLPPPMVSAWMRNLMINGILITVISFLPGISWEGHLGGAIAGAVVSFLLHVQRFGAPLRRLAAVLGLLLVPVVCIGLVLWQMQTSATWRPLLRAVQQARQRISADEARGLLEGGNQLTRATLRLVRDHVLPTTTQAPLGRKPAALQDVLWNLGRRRAELQKHLELANLMGEFSDEPLEAKRRLTAVLLGDSLKLCQLAQTALEGGPDWKAHHEALEKAADQLGQRLQ